MAVLPPGAGKAFRSPPSQERMWGRLVKTVRRRRRTVKIVRQLGLAAAEMPLKRRPKQRQRVRPPPNRA
jgi:hypothetical protein